MAEERKWEDLQTDCLTNIFAKLDTETLVESVQYVSTSWYKTTLNPQCWRNLVFTEEPSDAFVKFVVARGQKSATSVVYHKVCLVSDRSLRYFSKGCPLLKILELPFIDNDSKIFPELIPSWKNLERLKIDCFDGAARALEPISKHCKNFNELVIHATEITPLLAEMMVRFTPKIKVLDMYACFVFLPSLVKILKGCKELEYLDIGFCIGVDERDDGLKKLVSHVKVFKCGNARGAHRVSEC